MFVLDTATPLVDLAGVIGGVPDLLAGLMLDLVQHDPFALGAGVLADGDVSL